MDYARIHQLGGDISRKPSTRKISLGASGSKMVKTEAAKRTREAEVGGYTIHIPARPVLGVSTRDEEDIRREVDGYLGEGIE